MVGPWQDKIPKAELIWVKYPRGDSNARTWLRRPLLYPLSYGGWFIQNSLAQFIVNRKVYRNLIWPLIDFMLDCCVWIKRFSGTRYTILQPLSTASLWRIFTILLAGLTLGCSLLSRLPLAGEEARVAPTRTPFPTFTSTPPVEQPTIVIPPTPTETPVPPTPTPPPAQQDPPAEPAPPEPEPTATNTPVPPPTEPPPPPPTEPPPPAEPPPAQPGVGANGIIGKLEFRDGRNVYGVGEKVFVRIEASTETGTGQKPFGVLGLTTSTGNFQTSWSNGTIDGVFRHEDGVDFSAPGTHKIWLSICFSSIEVCQGADGNWERFEPGLDVIIQ